MPKVLTEQREHIFIIAINRADQMNCVDGETAELLMQAWLKFRDDDNLFVAVLTGAGEKSFCAGADLKNVASLMKWHTRQQMRWNFYNGPGFMGYTRGTDIFKPIIGAINGYAFAGGLELACLCDFRIAAENAEFGCLERRFNVPLLDGGTQRLPRIVGLGNALELIITGKRIDVREAHRIGLVNEIVPREKLMERVMEIAGRICEMPQGALRSDKQAVMMGLGRTLEDGLRMESALGQSVFGSHDLFEGPTAFAQKRKPEFDHE